MTASCPCVATCCECSPSHRTFLVIPELRREVQYWEETKGKQDATPHPHMDAALDPAPFCTGFYVHLQRLEMLLRETCFAMASR